MGVSKVIYGGNTLIDLTSDTVDASKVLSGFTAHDKTGAIITGECTYDADTSDATAGSDEILSTKTAYVTGAKVTGSMVNNGAITASIALVNQQYTVPIGYHDGSGKVGILEDEKLKIVPENIRQGISILGVEGSMSGSEDVMAETKTVTPTTSSQTILPDTASGYNYLSQVTVAAIPYVETENTQGGVTVTIG